MSQELNVTVGDVVAVDNGYTQLTITTVKRITPTGQIVVNHHDMRFDKFGWEIGGSAFRQRSVKTLTPQIQAMAMRDKIKHVDWNKVTDSEIMQIAELLGFIRRKTSEE